VSAALEPSKPSSAAGRHDAAALRQAKRTGRQRGCWVYIPASELERCGLELDAPAPRYRAWPGRRRTVLVQLYPAAPAGGTLPQATERLNEHRPDVPPANPRAK
jgi:hypothetical protein